MPKQIFSRSQLVLIALIMITTIATLSFGPSVLSQSSAVALQNAPAKFTTLEISDYLTGTSSSANQKIITTASGTGINGPKNAQIGQSIFLKKASSLNGSAVGEIDGQYITVRQEGLGSDSSGQLIDIQRNSDSTGFLSATETSTTYVESNKNMIKYGINVQTGVLNNSNGKMGDRIGLVLTANKGKMTSALRLQDDNVGAWSYFIQAFKHQTPTWAVTDVGDVQAANSFRIGTAGPAPFQVDKTGHMYAKSVEIGSLGNYINDAAAQSGGVPIGGLYRNASSVQIRVE